MADFWRTELWHPVTVHFPIALLLAATLFLLISFFVRQESKKLFQNGAFMVLVLGAIGAWVSLYTGDLADGIVARKLCDPTVLKDHELASKTMTYLFTAAALIHISFFFNLLGSRMKQISLYVIFVFMLVGSVFLIRTGHLGASIVYQQGAGVHNHSVDCDEYR